MKICLTIVIAFASCALAASSFAAQADYYLKIEGIEGESSAAKGDHKDWINLESFTLDAPQGAPRDAASGMATGKRQHKPISVTKPLDKASPKLAEALAKGTVFKSVEIGGPGVVHSLRDVTVTSIKPGSGSAAKTETVTFSYAEIESKPVKEKPARAVQAKETTAKPVRAPN